MVAFLFLPLFYVAIKSLPPAAFCAMVLIGILVAQYELYRFYYPELRSPVVWGLMWGALCALAFYWDVVPREVVVSVATMTVLLWQLRRFSNARTALLDSSVVLFGILYVAWLLGHLILLRRAPAGSHLVLFVVLLTWGGDAAAYYVGRWLGHVPLSPAISPKKTVEGAVAGLLASLALAFVGRAWLLPGLSVVECVALGLGLGLLAQVGDLTESLLKRGAGVKDSGWLIPGHGGVLDKVDGLLLTAPVFYYYAHAHPMLWFGASKG